MNILGSMRTTDGSDIPDVSCSMTIGTNRSRFGHFSVQRINPLTAVVADRRVICCSVNFVDESKFAAHIVETGDSRTIATQVRIFDHKVCL